MNEDEKVENVELDYKSEHWKLVYEVEKLKGEVRYLKRALLNYSMAIDMEDNES